MANEVKLSDVQHNQALATKFKYADANGDNVIKDGEMVIWEAFGKELKDSGAINDDDYKKYFGSDIKSTTTPQREYTKKEYETAQKNVLQYLKENSKTEPSKLVETINDRLQESAETKPYTQAMETVNNILASIAKAGYSNKKDVEALEDKVKKDLKLDKFGKKVLKELVKNAEIDQRTKEYNEMKAKYYQYKQDGDNEEVAYNKVKVEYKDKGSYYNDYLKGANFGYKLTHWKGKMSKFEQGVIMREEINRANETMVQSESTSGKKVREDAKKEIGDARTKYTDRAFKSSQVKKSSNNIAKHNIYEDRANEEISEKEVHKYVKDGILFDRLISSGLIKKNENGTYNISLLSEVIGDYIGGELTNSRTIKELRAVSEGSNLMTVLNTGSNEYGFEGLHYNELDNGNVNDLVDLCYGDNEKNNWAKTAVKKVVGGGILGGAGAMGGVPNNVRNTNRTEVNIKLEGMDASEVANNVALSGGGQVTQVGNAVQIIVESGNVINLFRQAPQYLLCAAGKGALIGAALNLLTGLDDKKVEIPITNLDFECTTYDKYEEMIQEQVRQKDHPMNQELADVLLMVAKAFVTDGETLEMDCEGFKSLLRRAAGKGSNILNKDELYGALIEIKKKPPVPPTKKPEPVVSTTPVEEEEEEEDPTPTKCPLTKNEVHVKNVNHKIVFGDSWEELVEAYFPTWRNCFKTLQGSNGAVRALKRAIAKNDAEYQKLLGGYIPSSINIPNELGGCKRDGDEAKDLKFRQPTGAPKGYMGGVGKDNTQNTVTLTDCDNYTGVGTDIDSAIISINEARPGANYTKDDIVETEE